MIFKGLLEVFIHDAPFTIIRVSFKYGALLRLMVSVLELLDSKTRITVFSSNINVVSLQSALM